MLFFQPCGEGLRADMKSLKRALMISIDTIFAHHTPFSMSVNVDATEYHSIETFI